MPATLLIVLSLKLDLEAKDDEKLAHCELRSLARGLPTRISAAAAAKALGLKRPPGAWAGRTLFKCDVPKSYLPRLIKRLAFWDCIYWKGTSQASLGVAIEPGLSAAVTVSSKLEATVRISGKEIAEQVEHLTAVSTPSNLTKNHPKNGLLPSVRKKNDYLSHPFHKYKAKFFPRMARSLINIVCPTDSATVFDPFSGSGTTALEASFMGLQAIGHDIDPLSTFIGKVKCELSVLEVAKFNAARLSIEDALTRDKQLGLFAPRGTSKAKVGLFKVPTFLIARNPAKFPVESVKQFEAEVNALLAAINSFDQGPVRDWLLLGLSHALATKISLRWMGTGDDRFALEVSPRALATIFRNQLKLMAEKAEVYRAIRAAGILGSPGLTTLAAHDVTASPLPSASVDGIVTSPPYLPAASGRETYLRSRAISLIALNLLTEEEVLEYERLLLGSILTHPSQDWGDVPKSVHSLASWMIGQRAREPKALPTIAYFQRLGASFREMYRVLKPGGRAAVVVSKYHQFYELVSRKFVREFDMSAAVAEVARTPRYGASFIVDDVIDIELPKMDYVARPGSKAAYFESIIILRKPNTKALA